MTLIYDQDLYDSLYELTLPDGRVFHYTRRFLFITRHWESQLAVLQGLGVSGDILIVGCGFNPLLENLGANVWGTDPSPYIQEHKATESKVPDRILPYRVPSGDLESGWDWVITDDVLPGYSFEESGELLRTCHELGNRVVHFVTPKAEIGTGDERLTWALLGEWAVLDANAIWIDNTTMRVINA